MLLARDLMTNDVRTIHNQVTVAQAIALMQSEHVRSLIVICPEDADGYGIMTERDIIYQVIAPQRDPTNVRVNEIMRKPCISVHPDLEVHEVAQVFADTGIQRAPVIVNHELLGVISITDLLMKMDVGSQPTIDTLSRHLQEALFHARGHEPAEPGV